MYQSKMVKEISGSYRTERLSGAFFYFNVNNIISDAAVLYMQLFIFA
jgi:hypothetical protein